jgi:hypothetical protein
VKKIVVVSGMSVFAFVSGCNKKEEGAAVTTGGFLTPASFTGVTPSALTKEEVAVEINKETQLYDNKKSSVGTPADDSSGGSSGGGSEDNIMELCEKESSPKIKVIDKATISVAANVDFMSCIKTKAANAGQPAPAADNVFKINYVINLFCAGADFSSLDGKTVEEAGLNDGDAGTPSVIEEKCTNSSSRKFFINGESEVAMTDPSVGTIKSKSKTAMFNKDGGGCELVKVEGGAKSNACLTAEVTETEGLPGASGKKTDLRIFESVNLIDLDSATAEWFNGGEFKVTLNNFTGNVVYTNSTTAPNYTLTAAGGLSASGVIGSAPTLLPVESAPAANPFAFAQKNMKALTRRASVLVR